MTLCGWYKKSSKNDRRRRSANKLPVQDLSPSDSYLRVNMDSIDTASDSTYNYKFTFRECANFIKF